MFLLDSGRRVRLLSDFRRGTAVIPQPAWQVVPGGHGLGSLRGRGLEQYLQARDPESDATTA